MQVTFFNFQISTTCQETWQKQTLYWILLVVYWFWVRHGTSWQLLIVFNELSERKSIIRQFTYGKGQPDHQRFFVLFWPKMSKLNRSIFKDYCSRQKISVQWCSCAHIDIQGVLVAINWNREYALYIELKQSRMLTTIKWNMVLCSEQ